MANIEVPVRVVLIPGSQWVSPSTGTLNTFAIDFTASDPSFLDIPSSPALIQSEIRFSWRLIWMPPGFGR